MLASFPPSKPGEIAGFDATVHVRYRFDDQTGQVPEGADTGPNAQSSAHAPQPMEPATRAPVLPASPTTPLDTGESSADDEVDSTGRDAGNYFMTVAFLAGCPEDFYYDIGRPSDDNLPLPIRAFLTEWRKHLGRSRAEYAGQLDRDFDEHDLFLTLNYCIDHILRRIVPRYARQDRKRARRQRRRAGRAACKEGK
jgi:hypothetical protein